jgi:hypothetical protein
MSSFSVFNINNDANLNQMQILFSQTQNQHVSPFNILIADTDDYSWENLYICPAVSSGISIGFAPPELDNTFDRFKEDDYLKSVGLQAGYIVPDGYPTGSRVILSRITQSNPRPGNITPFTMYAIIGGVTKQFTVSRTVSIDTVVPNVTYIINAISVTSPSGWTAYTITNGNYYPASPSVLTINTS